MKDISAAIEAIKKQLPEIECRLDEPMKNHTAFKIGGNVAAMYFPKSQNDMMALAQILRDIGIRPLIIGNGSNILADDGPLDLIVVKTQGCYNGIQLTGDMEITAESGALLSKIAVFALAHQLTGFEFAHGIPGTLGGAVSMNAGAYGGEIKDVVTKTTALKTNGFVDEIIGDAHDFSYRHSRFSCSEDIILSSVINLTKGDPNEIRSTMDALSKKRRESQPLNMPSAGSTFKRPTGGYSATLIDQAGLKGFTVGGAMVSEKHAGFVVNLGNATFKDVIAVVEHIRETVFKQSGIRLEPEVKIIRSELGKRER